MTGTDLKPLRSKHKPPLLAIELADLLEIHPGSLSRIENGHYPLSPELAEKAEAIFKTGACPRCGRCGE